MPNVRLQQQPCIGKCLLRFSPAWRVHTPAAASRLPFPQMRPVPARPATLSEPRAPPWLGTPETRPDACAPLQRGGPPRGRRRGHEVHRGGCLHQRKPARTWRRSQPRRRSRHSPGCTAMVAEARSAACIDRWGISRVRETPRSAWTSWAMSHAPCIVYTAQWSRSLPASLGAKTMHRTVRNIS